MQLKIVLWNANGLAQHTEEVKNYIQNQQVDIMLISETHFTARSYFKTPNYEIYDTQHPDDNSHGGTAIFIKKGIKTLIAFSVVCICSNVSVSLVLFSRI